MSWERPEAIGRLDLVFAAARLAHEVIWDLHDEMVDAERYDEVAREAMRQAARVVMVDIPTLLTEARRLRALWEEQALLDPGAAEATARELDAELDRVGPELQRLRDVQNQIAREFQERVAESD